jgi:hypothetical protein
MYFWYIKVYKAVAKNADKMFVTKRFYGLVSEGQKRLVEAGAAKESGVADGCKAWGFWQ